MSMRATGVIEWLRGDGRYRLLDGFDPAMTYPQRLEIRRQALMSGPLHHGRERRDGRHAPLARQGGNRIARGVRPPQGDYRGGTQQDVANRDEAEERIRTIAAPQNIARHPDSARPAPRPAYVRTAIRPTGYATPAWGDTLRCWPDKRVLVVLIDQDLGL